MFEVKYIICGALVGFMTGLTGIGGGSLMTPILILLLGFPPNTAVGTDLLFSFFTKVIGVASYSYKKYVEWKIVFLLAVGSLPATGLIILFLHWLHINGHRSDDFTNKTIGVVIIFSTLVYLGTSVFRKIINQKTSTTLTTTLYWKKTITILLGGVIGATVTLTSIGAGILGTVALMIFYPRLKPINLIATELAHAIPITFIAGISYMFLMSVDFKLLFNLIIGSLPATYIASCIASKIPHKLLTIILAMLLMIIALRMLLN